MCAQAERAVAAGAKFIVAPGLNPDVVKWCLARSVPVIPGVATASEVEKALGLGLTDLKFFPAEPLGGVSMLKALSAPYKKARVERPPCLYFGFTSRPLQVRWMPTGGVTPQNAGSYLALPQVLAVGGSWLVPTDALRARDFARITQVAKAAVQLAAGR